MFYVLAFLCAVLSGLGVGSAGLLVVLLSTMLLVEHVSAQGINLIFFIISSFAAIFVNAKKRSFYPRIILIMIVFGATGSILGAKLAISINPTLIRKIFGWMLISAGGLSLINLATNFIKSLKKRKNLKKCFTK